MRLMAAAALSGVVAVLAGCGRDETQPPETAGATAGAATPAPDAVVPPPTDAAEASRATEAGPGAPAFAVIYPGGKVEVSPTTANGPTGPGGIVTYTTPAGPDAVIAFHRQHAEADGLSSVMAMNQGEARAYGAARPDTGANVQVVAAPTEDGQTSVQLSWSAGL